MTWGILTVGIVTKPFSFEGKRKMSLSEQGIANLMMHVDSLIVIPNERLKLISQEKITLMNAFERPTTFCARALRASPASSTSRPSSTSTLPTCAPS